MTIINQHIVIFSASPWDGMMFQRQRFALEFAKQNNVISFIENIPQQKVTMERVVRVLKGQKNYLDSSLKIKKTESIEVFSPFCLPETVYLSKYYNRIVMKRLAKEILKKGRPSHYISYIPGQPVLDLQKYLQPVRFIYASIHNYRGLGVSNSVVKAEVEISQMADSVLADSTYTANYLSEIRGEEVGRCLPGVSFDRFHSAFRGDEADRKLNIGYFGFLGKYYDVGYFNRAIKEGYSVTIIGQSDPQVRSMFHKDINLIPTALNEDLPEILRDIDILMLPYYDNSYTLGVMPAKLYECFATGKPIFWTHINETKYFKDIVYTVKSYDDFIRQLKNLNEKTHIIKRTKQLKLAKDADWQLRFNQFDDNCDIPINKLKKNKNGGG
jgi:glycosyltransferase involved in cell wall biosynthesis